MFVRITSASLLVMIAASVAACGGGTQDEAPQTGGEQAGPAAQVENAGRVNGMVNFAGTPPANAAIDMSEEATCAQKHSDPPTAETVIANNGKLQNVFVYVKEGLSGSFSPPSQAVEIDQDGCVYMPHVTGVMTGQQLVFRNSDGILHNIKATPSEQPGFNISQPNNMTSTRTLRAQEVMVPVQCDVHGWMEAYVGVVDHPYFAVSGEDGSFTIENLPPGTYTVEAWHEKYGTQTQQVTVGANETVDLAFDYNASMANAVVPMGRPIDPHGSHAPARAGGE